MGSRRPVQVGSVLVLALQLCALAPIMIDAQPASSSNDPLVGGGISAISDSAVTTLMPPTPLLQSNNPSPSAQPVSSLISGASQQQLQGQQQQGQQGEDQSAGGNGSATPASRVPNATAGKTRNEQDQAAAANQGAPDSGSTTPRGGPAGNDGAVNLLSVAGCNNGASKNLPAGLGGSCEVQGVISRRETDLFSFSLPQVTNGTRPYRLLLILRTVDGDAQLGLSIPTPSGTDPVPDTIGTQVYGTEITTEVIIELPWYVIAQSPGRYLASISRARRRALYTLQVLTPFNDVLLAEPDLTAIKDLHQACCVAGGATSTLCTQFLPRALAPNHSPDDDLCRMTPMTCNSEGRLTQLALAQAGLICPSGLPASVAQMDTLVTMDLAFNFINMSTAGVAKIIGSLSALQNAFLRYTGIRGPLSCELVSNPTLTRLSMSGNNITGSMPACMLQDATLQELYLSQTSLTGPLADSVPPNSPLRLLYAINFIQPEKTGLSGPIPPSLLSSPSLTYLNLANNALSGGLGEFPAQLRVLNISNNNLDGRISGTLPAGIETFDASYNGLQGPLPDGLATLGNITLFDVSYNNLSGSLPAQLPSSVAVVDFGNNQFTGGLPAVPSSVRYMAAANNQLGGPLTALPDTSQLRFLYLQGNQLTGTLPASLIDGRAPLLLIDLHGNKLAGQLDNGGSGSTGGGRRLLQQQQSVPDASAAVGAWSLDTLAFLDLSQNGFSGTIPASLGGLQSLSYLDLSSNSLTGSLEPYSDAMASNTSVSSLLYLNVSSNRLNGGVPQSLAAAPMLDPGRVSGRRSSAGVPRVLDLSSNAFEGAFPIFLISQAEQAQAACANVCSVRVLLNGTNMALACPDNLQVTQAQLRYLQQADYQCWDMHGQQVSLLAATSLPASTDANGSRPGSATIASGQLFINGQGVGAQLRQQQPQQLAPGAIAGIVIGSVVGAVLLVGAVAFGYKKMQRHRAGWRKDNLAGGPPGLNDAFGVTGLPPSSMAAQGPHAGTAGAAARPVNGINGSAARVVRFGESGDPAYPHTPYERSQAGIEMLTNRHNEV